MADDEMVAVDMVLPKRVWDQVEAARKKFEQLGDGRTSEQVAADAIAAGCSLTHGTG